MKKTYTKPSTDVVEAQARESFLHGSWGVDGDHKPTIDGNPDEIDAKKDKFSAWETWDDED